MFNGNLIFKGAPITGNIIIIVGFLTAVLSYAQDGQYSIPLLDILQSFLCWPTVLEGFCIAFCLWSFRHIERLLGQKSFILFFLYNFLSYIPTFLLVTAIKGFKYHFSFLFFIPFSLFIFMFWKLPSVVYSGPLTDKFIVCLAVFIITLLRFPFSIMAILSGVCGYYLWNTDLLKLKRMLLNHAIPVNENDRGIVNTNIGNNNTPLVSNSLHSMISANSNAIRTITGIGGSNELDQLIGMGFPEDSARPALQIAHNDVNRAVDYLLSHP